MKVWEKMRILELIKYKVTDVDLEGRKVGLNVCRPQDVPKPGGNALPGGRQIRGRHAMKARERVSLPPEVGQPLADGEARVRPLLLDC